MPQRLTGTLFNSHLGIMMMHGLPLWPRFLDVNWLEAMTHSFDCQMQFAVYAVTLVVGVSPQFSTRCWRLV
jgi:hypothetical protein